MFDNGSEFKQYFTTFLEDFNIKPILRTIKIPQANAQVDHMHKLILNILVTNYIANKVFDYINP